MSFNKDDMEKALTVFRKPEITVVGKPESIAGQSTTLRHFPNQPEHPVAGRTYTFPQDPSPIAGRIRTVRHYEQEQRIERPSGRSDTFISFDQPHPRWQEPLITDQLGFPRVCSQLFSDWRADYVLRDNRLYWAGGVRIDEIRRHLQYDGLVHQSYEVNSSMFGVEECACCGATGNGAIHCLNCERQGRSTFLCWGFVYVKGSVRYTRCPICRNESALVDVHSRQSGIFPKARPR